MYKIVCLALSLTVISLVGCVSAPRGHNPDSFDSFKIHAERDRYR